MSPEATHGEPIDRTADLQRFVDAFGFERVAPARCSVLLYIQLFMAFTARTLYPHRVLYEIQALEGVRSSATKPATEFTGPHLRGLWHKHFIPNGIPAIARNLRNALKEYGLPEFEKQVRETHRIPGDHYLTASMIDGIIHEAVVGNLERRSHAAKLTGERLIFARHQNANYYLAIGCHDEGDERLRDQIDQICRPEFPFLSNLLGD